MHSGVEANNRFGLDDSVLFVDAENGDYRLLPLSAGVDVNKLFVASAKA